MPYDVCPPFVSTPNKGVVSLGVLCADWGQYSVSIAVSIIANVPAIVATIPPISLYLGIKQVVMSVLSFILVKAIKANVDTVALIQQKAKLLIHRHTCFSSCTHQLEWLEAVM